jgi:hypothetical protein
VVFLGVLAGVAWAPSDPSASDTGAQIPVTAATLGELRAATYEGIFDYPVTLIDGCYEGEPFVEGGASATAALVVGAIATIAADQNDHDVGDDDWQRSVPVDGSGRPGSFIKCRLGPRVGNGVRNHDIFIYWRRTEEATWIPRLL